MTHEQAQAKTQVGAAISERQNGTQISDAEVARQLGLAGESVVSLIKRGVLLPSLGLANEMHNMLEVTLPEAMHWIIADHGQDVTEHFKRNIERMLVSSDEQDILLAYRSVQEGSPNTRRIKVANATVFVVPDDLGEEEARG